MKRWQFGVRALLVLITLVGLALSFLTRDEWYHKQVVQYQRTAHAFDIGGGYTISESALVFEGQHRWLKGRKKLFAVLLGHAGMGVQNVAGGQINILQQSLGEFTIQRSSDAVSMEWKSSDGVRTIPLATGKIFEGKEHQRWEQLFNEQGELPAELANAIQLSPAQWDAFVADGSVPMWTAAALTTWLGK